MTTISFSTQINGSLQLFAYDEKNPHRRMGVWFSATPKPGQMSVPEARTHAEDVMREGYCIRVQNSAGDTVFLGRQQRVEFPADVEAFWRECGR